ncbi:MAG TPA: peptidoglycan DD-metalloendopeptidase family protein [Candidatus Binatia bacterium]|nr:peptidoglycan DD-metalloendopeptidase family protein [Candidatus Binatia bacterium]
MPRRHPLVDLLPRSTTTLLVLACFALLPPQVAHAVRRKRQVRPGHGGHARHNGRPPRPKLGPARAADGGSSVEEHVHIRRGDTLESVLAARGVGTSEARPWVEAATRVYDLRRVQPRRGVTLRFDRESRALEEIRYEIDDHTLLILAETPDGVEARRESLPYFTEVKGVAGRIDRGLREDAAEMGVPEQVIAGLGDIFGWDVDVENGLHAGDEFRVLYENMWQAGIGVPQAGNVIGASLVARGRAVTAVYFEHADGRGAYYRPSGEALSRTFLRYPVDFTEITSEFSLLRFHPILHVDRPHLGVDFAAPRGTPVRAAASGAVSYSGWLRGLGRCVRIDHADGITSTYGHLSRIAAGLDVGGAVERGQVIGYVGATGLATGPHLHYGLERDGEYVDPLALRPATEGPIPPDDRRAFERVETEVVRHLAALRESGAPQTVFLSRLSEVGAQNRPE